MGVSSVVIGLLPVSVFLIIAIVVAVIARRQGAQRAVETEQ